jgi:hypothetical protein
MVNKSKLFCALLITGISLPVLANNVSPLEICSIGQRGNDCDKAPSAFGSRLISYAEMETGKKYRCSFQTREGQIRFEKVSMRDGTARFTITPAMQGNFGKDARVFLVDVHYVPTSMGLDVTLRNTTDYARSMMTYCDKIN